MYASLRAGRILALGLCLAAGCSEAPELGVESAGAAESYADLLSHRGTPSAAEDWSFAPFSDQGAWFGMALSSTGFSGPFLMTSGRWIEPELVRLEIMDTDSGRRVAPSTTHPTSLPGLLRRVDRGDGLEWTQELWFDSSTTALLRAELTNTGAADRRLDVSWSGSVYSNAATLEQAAGGVIVRPASGEHFLLEVPGADPKVTLHGPGYTLAIDESVELGEGQTVTSTLAISFSIRSAPDVTRSLDPEGSYRRNRQRWGRYVGAVEAGGAVAVKAVQTLIDNWRAPAGRLRYGGLFPSSNIDYFNGFWAWDSWKHAVGLVRFDQAIAKDQVREMFDHQDASGMIADVVYLDPAEDNWRDTKPPLAGWAIETIYDATGDLDFVRELYPKLVAYHAFWYRDRDHDRDGLCEYGSTDGTLEAARWESGMDNAVRFDATRMVQNGPAAWSMNQESVDLNSYLYREKRALFSLADALGRNGDASRWESEARALRALIQNEMYDEQSGWFYDIEVDSGDIVSVQGPEGWIPLWAGVATDAQAARVRVTMLDEDRFRTYVPFPTVSRAHSEFSDGYWRGLVWLDQAYFAIEGLRRYGYDDDADSLTRQLFENLDGVTTPGVPIYENYDPLTGEGRNAKHFSWSAAHLLLLALTPDRGK